MCLTTNNAKIKIAQEDIFVYKECRRVSKEKCTAEYHNFSYEVGVPSKRIPLSPHFNGDKYTVDQGYHSYNFPNKYTNTLFVIPKGTEYISGYFNSNPFLKERASTTIIYLGMIKHTFVERILLKLGFKKPFIKK